VVVRECPALDEVGASDLGLEGLLEVEVVDVFQPSGLCQSARGIEAEEVHFFQGGVIEQIGPQAEVPEELKEDHDEDEDGGEGDLWAG